MPKEDPGKVYVRSQILDAIDIRIHELVSHHIAVKGEDFPYLDLMENQRNRVAVFLGESKHRYQLKKRTK